jgi:hypothetical protein
MQRAFGQKRARSLVSAAKSGRRCRRGRRLSPTALVPLGGNPQNEALYDCRAQRARLHIRGRPGLPETVSRSCPTTTLHSRSGHFSPN